MAPSAKIPFPDKAPMRISILLTVALAAPLVSCGSTSSSLRVVDADPLQRDTLFQTLKSLEGEWIRKDATGSTSETEFRVSSGGSTVRELMFPGEAFEMTNMYALDGNSVVMTHYCASGNQPRMRAQGVEGNRLAFAFEDVSDLKAKDETYMGEMTLVFVDGDHIEQHWRALRGSETDHESVFQLTRKR